MAAPMRNCSKSPKKPVSTPRRSSPPTLSKTVESCVTDQSFKDFVEKSSKEALDSGVEATPWVLINGKQTDKTSDPQALTLEILEATGEFKG